MVTIEGAQFKIVLVEGRLGVSSSSGTLARVWSEDDTNWFPMGDDFDALWLGELASLAKEAHKTFKHSKNGRASRPDASSNAIPEQGEKQSREAIYDVPKDDLLETEQGADNE